ncbi:MAG: hypothetical protein ACREBU_06750 [Nitrososphaera sp.]
MCPQDKRGEGHKGHDLDDERLKNHMKVHERKKKSKIYEYGDPYLDYGQAGNSSRFQVSDIMTFFFLFSQCELHHMSRGTDDKFDDGRS